MPAPRTGAATEPAPGRLGVPVLLLLGAILAFANNQSLGIVLPVHLSDGLGGTAADVGLVGGAATIGVLAGRSVAARAVLHIGRRRTLLLAGGIMTVVSLAYLTAGGIAAVAGLRILHGAGFALATSTFFIVAADAAGDERRGEALARAGLAMPVSLALFPVLAAEGLGNDFQATCVFAAVLSTAAVAAFAPAARRWPRRRADGPGSEQPTDPGLPASASALDTDTSGIRTPAAMSIAAASALGVADGVVLDLLPLFSRERGITGYGWFYTVFAVTMIAALPAVPRLLSRAGALGGGVIGLGALAACFFLLAQAQSLVTLMMIAVLYGAGFAVAQTALSLGAAAGSGAACRARRLGAFFLVFDIGRGAGVSTAGWLATLSGFGPMLLAVAVFVLVCLALLGGGQRLVR